ncbi:MAG: monovalent cation/H(+) antiporter subunit G, partial [candidate division NC10 bacterium]
MPNLQEILIAALCLLGTFLIVLACIGLVRFPDVFCRMHAAGKAGTLGVVLVALGATVVGWLVAAVRHGPRAALRITGVVLREAIFDLIRI